MRDAVGVCVWGSYVCSARGWDDAGLGGIFSCDSVWSKSKHGEAKVLFHSPAEKARWASGSLSLIFDSDLCEEPF